MHSYRHNYLTDKAGRLKRDKDGKVTYTGSECRTPGCREGMTKLTQVTNHVNRTGDPMPETPRRGNRAALAINRMAKGVTT